MKPYLISVCSVTPGLDRFLEGVKKIDVEHVMVALDPYPGHIEKYNFFPKDLDPDRYVVFLDTDDVIIQKELPEFTHDLYLSAENAKHKDTIWKQVIEETHGFEELMYEDIYNVGSWAMRVSTMYEMLDFFKDSGLMGQTKLADQLLFNLFIRKRVSLSRVVDNSIFCALFANFYVGDVEKQDGLWKTGGKVISCVHANGADYLKDEL